ncbi:hypothetical protein FN846DRAFT_894820 [Sphaerosporella brunnea]|uniref:Uncharacterized protein n=1 Tax=Sphaerosporella brunnea TaxID=1250544 RepID=A0A5J5EG88_9PEZI|nr:hypothetical protein FN846DRAFT_894820 [Sphaerosporella brunnea]
MTSQRIASSPPPSTPLEESDDESRVQAAAKKHSLDHPDLFQPDQPSISAITQPEPIEIQAQRYHGISQCIASPPPPPLKYSDDGPAFKPHRRSQRWAIEPDAPIQPAFIQPKSSLQIQPRQYNQTDPDLVSPRPIVRRPEAKLPIQPQLSSIIEDDQPDSLLRHVGNTWIEGLPASPARVEQRPGTKQKIVSHSGPSFVQVAVPSAHGWPERLQGPSIPNTMPSDFSDGLDTH